MRFKLKILFFSLCIATTSKLYASKARLFALGQDGGNRSYYINDTRSVFVNSAYLNFIKDYIVTEVGEPIPGKDYESNAEGGVFKEVGYFLYGIYLGSDMEGYYFDEKLAQGFLTADNRVDLFFAGDAGIEWGIRTNFAFGKDDQSVARRKFLAVGLGLGVVVKDAELYTNFNLKDSAEGSATGTDKWNGDIGIQVGGAYVISDLKIFAEYSKLGYTSSVGSTTNEYSDIMYTVGLGKIYEMKKGMRMFSDIMYRHQRTKLKGSYDSAANVLPINVAFEADVNSWLSIRGSIKQYIFGSVLNIADKLKSIGESTEVAAGVTLKFGAVRVEGIIDKAFRLSLNYWF
ncbi:MAG: hypothetical protein ISR65_15605 [Bacteriovoracaceae bacterium]|nr:hypothetical protein [Bacteriovoracaceae bacterium]